MKNVHRRFIFFMLFSSFVVYSFIVYTAGTESKFSIPLKAKEGRGIFRKYNCIACHQIYGLGGYMGPDLTGVISSKGSEYARVFIQNGTEKMPDFNLTESEIEALISYLTYIDSVSVYPQKKVQTTWYGTIQF